MNKQRPSMPQLRRELQHALQHARITATRARGTARTTAERIRGGVRAPVAYADTAARALTAYVVGAARIAAANRSVTVRGGLIAALVVLAAGLLLVFGGRGANDAAVGSAPAPGVPSSTAAAPPTEVATPAPPTAITTAAPACPEIDRTHLVDPGETLAQIALRYGSAVEQIASDSNLGDPNLINVAQQLKIRGLCRGTTVITPGATLAGYARQYSTTVAALLALNPRITNPHDIHAGGLLRLAPTDPT